jgi:hypothetical protein
VGVVRWNVGALCRQKGAAYRDKRFLVVGTQQLNERDDFASD